MSLFLSFRKAISAGVIAKPRSGQMRCQGFVRSI
jgi:hypothetical protein